jgi:predicted esterase
LLKRLPPEQFDTLSPEDGRSLGNKVSYWQSEGEDSMNQRSGFVIILAAALLVSTGHLAFAADGEDVPSIEPISPPPADAQAIAIPYIQDDAPLDPKAKPTFTTSAGDVSSRGWVAVTSRGLRFRIVVTDPEHSNPYHERNLWRGDCIYVSLDLRDDTARETNARGLFEPDDAVYIFALGSEGAQGRVSGHHLANRRGQDCSDYVRGISRDDKAGTTTYDLAIAYEDLNYAMGQSATIGLAVHVAHKSQTQKKDQSWGVMRGKNRKLHSLVPKWPETRFVTVTAARHRVFAPEEPFELILAQQGYDALSIEVWPDVPEAMEMAATFEPQAGEGIHRYRIRVPQAYATVSGGLVAVSVESPAQVFRRTFLLDSMEAAAGRVRAALLEGRVKSGLIMVDDDLVRSHHRQTWQILRSEMQNIPLRKDRSVLAEKFIDTANLILSKLAAFPQTRETFTRRCLPLVASFVSSHDRSLQWYWLQLPYDYDPEKTYPLTVYLHGAGSDEPLDGLTTAFTNTHQDTLFTGEVIDPENIPPTHRGFVLFPWARGNSMYWQGGQADVLQTLAIVREKYRIDPDRMYLTGFSMGCGGAYGIAGRTPDLWAGIGLASGFGPWAETSNTEFLKQNLTHVPAHIWCGQLDRMVEPARAFAKRMEQMGVKHEAVFPERMPHTYPYDHFQHNVGWLMQFQRSRPDTFSFTTDSFRFPGTRGVEMAVPFRRRIIDGKFPSFRCGIQGQTVRIDSEHTEALRVRLGPDGLGLQGPVKVIWNGKEAYKGPAETIKLGQSPWLR